MQMEAGCYQSVEERPNRRDEPTPARLEQDSNRSDGPQAERRRSLSCASFVKKDTIGATCDGNRDRLRFAEVQTGHLGDAGYSWDELEIREGTKRRGLGSADLRVQFGVDVKWRENPFEKALQ
jgi:hypothetical protein